MGSLKVKTMSNREQGFRIRIAETCKKNTKLYAFSARCQHGWTLPYLAKKICEVDNNNHPLQPMEREKTSAIFKTSSNSFILLLHTVLVSWHTCVCTCVQWSGALDSIKPIIIKWITLIVLWHWHPYKSPGKKWIGYGPMQGEYLLLSYWLYSGGVKPQKVH